MRALVLVVSVIYVLLVGIALVVLDLRFAFVPALVGILAFFLMGFLVFRPLKGAFGIPWPASSEHEAQGIITIQGVPLPLLGYEQELIISFRARRIPELTATAILAGSAVLAIFMGRASAGPLVHGGDLFVLELACMAGFGFLIFSLRWFYERRFLPKTHVAVGEIIGRDPGFLRAGITYQFFDDCHEGRPRPFCKRIKRQCSVGLLRSQRSRY